MGLIELRELYREQLDDVLADLAQMAQEVSTAVRSATTALLEADIHLAEQVISGDEQLDHEHKDRLIVSYVPRPFRRPFRSFAAAEGSLNYRRLVDGRRRYLSALLVKA